MIKLAKDAGTFSILLKQRYRCHVYTFQWSRWSRLYKLQTSEQFAIRNIGVKFDFRVSVRYFAFLRVRDTMAIFAKIVGNSLSISRESGGTATVYTIVVQIQILRSSLRQTKCTCAIVFSFIVRASALAFLWITSIVSRPCKCFSNLEKERNWKKSNLVHTEVGKNVIWVTSFKPVLY